MITEICQCFDTSKKLVSLYTQITYNRSLRAADERDIEVKVIYRKKVIEILTGHLLNAAKKAFINVYKQSDQNTLKEYS